MVDLDNADVSAPFSGKVFIGISDRFNDINNFGIILLFRSENMRDFGDEGIVEDRITSRFVSRRRTMEREELEGRWQGLVTGFKYVRIFLENSKCLRGHRMNCRTD